MHPADLRPAILGGPRFFPAGPVDWPLRDPEIAAALARIAQSGDWGRYAGPHLEQLQQRLAEMTGRKHVLLCASGTAAVELALRGVGVREEGEVVLSGYDFKGNAADVLALGGTPVAVDCKFPSPQFAVEHLMAACGPATQAVLVSHLHGGVVDMPALVAAARETGLPVIEDACQSPCAPVYGRPSGGWGDVSVFSFGGSKLLSAGRGGAVLTDRDDVRQRIRRHVDRGNDLSPLSELQAAVLLPQLERLDERRRQRNEAAAELRERLAGSAGIVVPPAPDHSEPDYYKVCLWWEAAAFAWLPRDRFAAAMRAEGFALWPGFRSLDYLFVRRRLRLAEELVNAHRADQELLVLHHPVLLSAGGESEPQDAIDAFAAAVEKLRRHNRALREAPANLFVSAAPWDADE